MTRERKSLIAGVGVLIFTVILAGVAVTAHTTNEPEPEWLMVMNAETGECQKVGDTYTLTLDGVDTQMLAFTDRPERQAQMWDTSAFLDYWANEFDGHPPNAVISADGVRVALMLSDPRVGMSTRDDGAVTPTAGAVTFTATPLLGHEERDITFDQPTLFIDGANYSPRFALPYRGGNATVIDNTPPIGAPCLDPVTGTGQNGFDLGFEQGGRETCPDS